MHRRWKRHDVVVAQRSRRRLDRAARRQQDARDLRSREQIDEVALAKLPGGPHGE